MGNQPAQNICPWLNTCLYPESINKKLLHTSHCPSLISPAPLLLTPSTPVLSNASEHYSEILPGRGRDVIQHHPSGRNTYLLSSSCLNDRYWFQNIISFGFFFAVTLLQAGHEEVAYSILQAWLDGSALHASLLLMVHPSMLKGCGRNINRALKAAQRNAVQNTVIWVRSYWLYFQNFLILTWFLKKTQCLRPAFCLFLLPNNFWPY